MVTLNYLNKPRLVWTPKLNSDVPGLPLFLTLDKHHFHFWGHDWFAPNQSKSNGFSSMVPSLLQIGTRIRSISSWPFLSNKPLEGDRKWRIACSILAKHKVISAVHWHYQLEDFCFINTYRPFMSDFVTQHSFIWQQNTAPPLSKGFQIQDLYSIEISGAPIVSLPFYGLKGSRRRINVTWNHVLSYQNLIFTWSSDII